MSEETMKRIEELAEKDSLDFFGTDDQEYYFREAMLHMSYQAKPGDKLEDIYKEAAEYFLLVTSFEFMEKIKERVKNRHVSEQGYVTRGFYKGFIKSFNKANGVEEYNELGMKLIDCFVNKMMQDPTYTDKIEKLLDKNNPYGEKDKLLDQYRKELFIF